MSWYLPSSLLVSVEVLLCIPLSCIPFDDEAFCVSLLILFIQFDQTATLLPRSTQSTSARPAKQKHPRSDHKMPKLRKTLLQEQEASFTIKDQF